MFGNITNNLYGDILHIHYSIKMTPIMLITIDLALYLQYFTSKCPLALALVSTELIQFYIPTY